MEEANQRMLEDIISDVHRIIDNRIDEIRGNIKIFKSRTYSEDMCSLSRDELDFLDELCTSFKRIYDFV